MLFFRKYSHSLLYILIGFINRSSVALVIFVSIEIANFSFTFLYLDKPSATRSSSTIELELGEDRSIGCPVDTGNPPAVITWYKGNDTSGKKVTSCSTLEVQNVALRNKGWYTCFAKNELGNTIVNLLLMVGKLKRFKCVFQ